MGRDAHENHEAYQRPALSELLILTYVSRITSKEA